MQRAKKANLRIVRLHGEPAEPFWLELADELGMMIIDETAVYCYRENYTWDQRFWENYRQHVQELVRRDRNHPSLVIYSMENEVLWKLFENPAYTKQWADAAAYVRQVDPTRLIYYESAPDPNGVADFVGLHYPHDYMFGNYLYPDESYWLAGPFHNEWGYGKRELQWKRDKPLYIGEWSLGLRYWRDYRSLFLGERAYTDPEAWTTGDLAYASFEVPALRRFGASGNAFINWSGQTVETFRRLYAPAAVFLREYDWHFDSGAHVTRTVDVFNDTFREGMFELRWQLLRGSEAIASGNDAARLMPAEHRAVAVTVPMPQVSARTELKFVAELLVDGQPVARDQRRFDVFPADPPRLANGEAIALLGEDAATAHALQQLGVRPQPVQPAQIGTLDGKVLVIAANGLTDEVAGQAKQIAAFVKAGGSVVCLPQKAWPKWLPLPVEMDPKHSATMTYRLIEDHPLLAGIEENDLRFWHPGHLVASHDLLKPARGNFRAVVEAGGRDGLKWCPLLEIFYGKGRYFLCQMKVTAKFETEPIARQFLANLLNVAASPADPMDKRLGLLVNSGAAAKFLGGLGVRGENVTGRLASWLGNATAPVRKSAGDKVLFIEAGGAAWEEAARQIDRLRGLVADGGVVWIHGAAPPGIDTLNKLAHADLGLDAIGAVAVTRSIDDPLLRGLSNYDLYWHEHYVWDRFVPYRPLAPHAFRLPADASVKSLLTPAVLLRVPCGKGFFLLDQVGWEKAEPFRQQAMRYVCTLLTNLNVAIRP